MSLRKLFVLSAFVFFLLLPAGAVLAQAAPSPITTEIPIPVAGQVEGYASGKVSDLANYIEVLYQFVIGIIGFVAVMMMIIGGFQYLTSAGDAGKIGAAKKRIIDALIGVVLAFSAWLLLNTINPALLQFKPLSGTLSTVQTELSFLPWCDEVIKTGVTVNPILGTPGQCGSVAEFMQDKSRVACLYRSSCPDEKFSDFPFIINSVDSKMHATCVQTLTNSLYAKDPVTSAQVLKLADSEEKLKKWKRENPQAYIPPTGSTELNKEYNEWIEKTIHPLPDIVYEPMAPRSPEMLVGEVNYFATCVSCMMFGAVKDRQVSPEEAYNKPSSPALCEYWQSEADQAAQKGGRPPSSMCYFIDGGCAQADFRCKPPGNGSCSSYDDIRPLVKFDLFQGGYVYWTYGSGKIGTMSSRPDALQEICTKNPCGYGNGGCTGETGFVDGIRTAAAVIRDNVSGIQSCTSK